MRLPASLLALALAIPLLLLPAAVRGASRVGSSLTCSSIPVLLAQMQAMHLDPPADQVLDERVTDMMLELLDPTRTSVLAGEVEALRQRTHQAVLDARAGDCRGIDALHAQRVALAQQLRDAVAQVLHAEGFQLDPAAAIVADPDKRPRPADRAAQLEAIRQMTHVQLAGYEARHEPMDAARGKLERRTERVVKSLLEMTPPERYALHLRLLAAAMDSHTAYLSADELEDFRINMELSLQGIGAVLSWDDGYTTVRELVAGGPAQRQGALQPKDRIVAVGQGEEDPVDVVGMDLTDVVAMIRGKKGTVVRLSVERSEGAVRSEVIAIERDAIELTEEAAALRFEQVGSGPKARKVAVLTLPSFYGGSGAEAASAEADVLRLLAEAKAGGAEGLVLDLGGNGGGLLSAAVAISGYFIGTGPIVGVASGKTIETEMDKDPGIAWTGPLVVYTNRGSASASEIVAGAMKDLGRAVVVGDSRTYGKGSVQQMAPLPAGLGALKVTMARFHRPSGESTQAVGVPADVVVPSLFDHREFGEEALDYALPPRTVGRLVGGRPNPDGANRWTPVDGATIEELSRRSAARVQADPAFAEIRKKLAEEPPAQQTVAALLAAPEEDDDVADADDGPSPALQEAVRVLADLIELQQARTARR